MSRTPQSLKATLIAAWMLTGTIPGLARAGAAVHPPKDIKAYDLDFNWGPGGPNGLAKPGLWADADPAKHVAWYSSATFSSAIHHM